MKPKILVVDDDEKNVMLLEEMMRSDGYETEAASNGIEAVEKARNGRPDLILMDIMMPKMDGYEALRRLKAIDETKYIPVIMLTGMSEIEDKLLGFEVGAEDYIVKPFSIREVSARVKSFLRMRTLQTRLMETEKMAALGEMVDGIAHEVRNPLMAIGGMARRLYEGETEPQHKEYAKRIISSVERLERMVRRIDEYKRILTSRFSAGDINAVAAATVAEERELIGDKPIKLKTALMDDPPAVSMDYINLKTALFNILQNSIDAIESKGEIIVETMPSPDEALIIRITDTGIGINKAEIRKIFSPFQTSKLEGAGLGLTITHRIVQDHGGEIEVESEPGKGTVVTVKLRPMPQARTGRAGAR